MTKDNELPPYWAYIEACRRCGCDPLVSREAEYRASMWDRITPSFTMVTILELAKMIAKHEQPPVDPDLLKAREIVAEGNHSAGLALFARQVTDGKHDTCVVMRMVLRALKIGRGEG